MRGLWLYSVGGPLKPKQTLLRNTRRTKQTSQVTARVIRHRLIKDALCNLCYQVHAFLADNKAGPSYLLPYETRPPIHLHHISSSTCCPQCLTRHSYSLHRSQCRPAHCNRCSRSHTTHTRHNQRSVGRACGAWPGVVACPWSWKAHPARRRLRP
jgi:hypothetical protein